MSKRPAEVLMRVAVGLLVGGAVGAVVVWRSWDASALGQNRWAAAVAVGVMAWVAAVIPFVQRLLPAPGHLPALLGAVMFAIYGCVPETGQIPPVAAAVALLTVVELGTHQRLPALLLTGAAGLVMWSGMFGATGRKSALVGTLFAFWPFVLVAAVFASTSARSLHTSNAGFDAPHGSIPAIAVAVVGSLAAIAVARTGALQPTIGPALRAVAVAAPVSASAAVIAALLLGQRRAHPLDRGG